MPPYLTTTGKPNVRKFPAFEDNEDDSSSEDERRMSPGGYKAPPAGPAPAPAAAAAAAPRRPSNPTTIEALKQRYYGDSYLNTTYSSSLNDSRALKGTAPAKGPVRVPSPPSGDAPMQPPVAAWRGSQSGPPQAVLSRSLLNSSAPLSEPLDVMDYSQTLSHSLVPQPPPPAPPPAAPAAPAPPDPYHRPTAQKSPAPAPDPSPPLSSAFFFAPPSATTTPTPVPATHTRASSGMSSGSDAPPKAPPGPAAPPGPPGSLGRTNSARPSVNKFMFLGFTDFTKPQAYDETYVDPTGKSPGDHGFVPPAYGTRSGIDGQACFVTFY